MPAAITTYRGVVYPSQCDAMGHMNVQYYNAAFDQAMWHLVLALGYRPSWVRERGQGWSDVRYVIEFRKELPVGCLFHVVSEVVRTGRSSLVSRHRILNSETEETAATVEMTSVYFDLQQRTSLPLPAELVANAAARVGTAQLPEQFSR